jgi:MFS family permease
VTSLFVYKAWNNELAVGNFNTLSTFLAVVTAYVLSRWEGYQHRKKGMALSSVLIILSTMLLALSLGPMSLLFFAILYTVGVTWFQVGFSAISFDVIEKEDDSRNRKLEYLTLREIPLAIGRLLGLSVFWYGQAKFGDVGLRAALVVLGLSQWGTFAFSFPKGQRKT